MFENLVKRGRVLYAENKQIVDGVTLQAGVMALMYYLGKSRGHVKVVVGVAPKDFAETITGNVQILTSKRR